MRKIITTITAILLCISVIVVCATVYEPPTEKSLENEFTDVKKSDWYYDDVKYVYENKLMTGIGEMMFLPSGETTRGMIVTMLWRVEGEPVEEGKDFEDVSTDAWYGKAVTWASNNKIVSGYSDTTFGPDDIATREQLATIMYRYASYKKCDLSKKVKLDKYEDKEQISDYAVESLEWANANGIISGTSEITISPKDNVLRSQVAAILRRFCDKYQVIHKNSKDNNNSKTSSGLNSSGTVNNKGEQESSGEINEQEEVNPIIIVDKVTAGAGDDVDVAVKISNNPGVLGMTLSLYYDESKCTLKNVKNGSAVEDVLNLTTSKSLGSGVRFVWDGIEIKSEDIRNGDIIILSFKVNENISEEKIPLTLKCFDGDVIDNNLNNIPLIIESGYINIK